MNKSISLDYIQIKNSKCSFCGYKYKDLHLSERSWSCPFCDITHDRDINAAINIKNEVIANKAGDVEIKTCGDETLVTSMKQEAPSFR